MRDGIAGTALPADFPYKQIIEQLCFENNVSPCLVGAIKMNETGLGQGPETENDISGDGGHGIMQLTSSFTDDWQDPAANIGYAIAHFIVPAWTYWAAQGETGEALAKCIAATYNAGLGNAQAGFASGDVDEYTTNNYGERAVTKMQALIGGTIPQ